MNIAVLGSTGMLGSMVVKYLRERGFTVLEFSRKTGLDLENGADNWSIINRVVAPQKPEYIINCMGAIKPTFSKNFNNTNQIYINALFPSILTTWADCMTQWGEFDCKVIHITTDCVYDGADGCYVEDSPHNCTDEYGMSKSLGEPKDCMVIRTSIIGPEWGGKSRSLVEWLISNQGGKVNGFTNHIWNGVTTLEYAKCLVTIIDNNLYKVGKFHIFSNDIDKFNLLSLMNTEWGLGIEVNAAEADVPCNRTLRTSKNLNAILKIADQVQMARDMRRFIYMER